MLALGKMSRSTYYYQLKRLRKTDKYSKVKERIKKIFEHNKGRYGYRRVHVILMREYQSMLKEHNITQSMSRKGNCLDNSVMENFFGKLKTEMFIGETFSSVEDFQQKLEEYICYFNNERVSLKLKGMSPVQFRTHSM